MSTTREYPERRLVAERKLGYYICHCIAPSPNWLMLWRAWECARCGKPIT